MKKIVFLIYLCTTISGMCQLKVSEQEALLGASQIMDARGFFNSQMDNISYDISNQGDTLLYEVAFDNGLSVLLSGTKKCIPILAVFKSNPRQSILNLNGNNGPAILVDNYRGLVEMCLNSSRQDYSLLWNNLLDTTHSDRSVRSVSHFLISNWGESESNDGIDPQAYNERCPYIGNCQAPVGSAAVALGQLMYYWKYPFFPVYNLSIFDWCNMGDELITTDECYVYKKKSISHLLYKCGMAVQSNYACTNTQASPSNVLDAVRNIFHFHSNSHFTQGPLIPDPQIPDLAIIFNNFWDNVRGDIDHRKPILGYIQERSNKHYFVCDGYTDDYKIRINWGDLSNNYNGEYSICNALDLFLLFDIYPQISYSIGECLYLTDYYSSCVSLVGNVPLYSIVPYTSSTLISAASTSSSSWRTIPFNATDVIYQAHEEIILQDGFEAEYGCEFEAKIEPCNQCDELREGNSYENNGELANDIANNISDNNTDDDGPFFSPSSPTKTIDTDLFPNPTDGPLTVAFDGEPQEVFVYTLDGRPVSGWRLTSHGDNFVTLDVSPLRSGPYLLSVVTTSGTRTARFFRL